jgi:glycosyltransferase involved in cell wall biosynthesis
VRLLIYGHHSATGFGVVTEHIGGRLVNLGVDVRVIAVNHRGEPVEGSLAGRVWPATFHGDSHGGNFSNAAIDGKFWSQFGGEWKPDAVLVVSDMSGLMAHLGPKGITETWRSVPVFHYCPIEGDNLSIGWRQVWQHIQPVAMSTYGASVIAEHIGNAVPMIYHGVDTEAFHPVAFNRPIKFDGKVLTTRDECKAAFGISPETRVILRSDRLVERKFYDVMFQVLPAIFDAVPEAEMVIHCSPVDNGMSLYEDIGRMAPEYHPRLKLTNAHDTFRGLPIEGMAALMNAADVYLSTTGGEGFGLNLAEALACETPVVVTDWAADAEVVGPGGVLVPPLIDRYGEPVRYHSRYGMDWAVPDARGFAEPVIDLLRKPARRRELGRAGRRHVQASFSWDEAAASFLGLLTEALVEPEPVAA